MRVVIVQHDLSGLGGSARVAVELGDGLIRRGHYVIFASGLFDIGRGYPKLYGKTVFRPLVPVSRIGGRFRAYSASVEVFSSLARSIIDFSPDAVFFSTQYDLVYFAKKLGAFRAVVYVHWPEKLQTEVKSLLRAFYRTPLEAMEKKGLACADAVLCNSYFTANVVRNLYGVLPKPVYPGVDTNFFRPADTDVTDGNLLVNIGRLDPSKNIKLSIDAVGILSREHRNVRLIIAGSLSRENVTYCNQLQQYVRGRHLEDIVKFMPDLSETDMLNLYQRCAVSLYPSWGEHFGLGPVEAMACAKPVLACNYGGPTETVADSVTGFTLPRDPEAWARRIMLLINDEDLRRRMGLEARRRVMENFTLERTTEEVEKALIG